jgi:integrase
VVTGYSDTGNPKRKYKYAPTQTKAAQLALQMVAAKESNQLVLTRDQSLETFMRHWLESVVKPNRAPKTYHFYRANIERHISPTLGRKKLTALATIDVQHLIHQLSKSGLKATTVRGVKATLSAALSYAYRMELVSTKITDRVSCPSTEIEERPFLNPMMARDLHRVSKSDPAGPLIAFGLFTGVRIGEALGLRWIDLDPEQRILKISKQLQRVDGSVGLRSLKSRSSRRNIPITSQIQEILSEQRTRFASLVGREPFPDEPIFTNTTGSAWDARNVNRRLKSLCQEAGVPVISFHALRHTAATLALAGGGDLHSVKGMLGHSQIALTANLYGHVQTESTRAAMSNLATFLDVRESQPAQSQIQAEIVSKG